MCFPYISQVILPFFSFAQKRDLVTPRLTCPNWKKFKKEKGKLAIIMTTFSKPKVETCCNIRPDQTFQFKAVFQILTVVIDLLRVPV